MYAIDPLPELKRYSSISLPSDRLYRKPVKNVAVRPENRVVEIINLAPYAEGEAYPM